MLPEKHKYIYLSVAAVPFILLIWGISILLSSPYLGLDFEQKNGKWYISRIDNESPAAIYPELLGKEVVSIAGWEIKQDDLQKGVEFIQTKKALDHFWLTNEYFYKNVHVKEPVTITVNDSKLSDYVITPTKGIPLLYLFNDLWPDILIILMYLFVGLTILLKKPDNPLSKIFFWVSLMVSMFQACLVIYSYRELALEPMIFQTIWPLYILINLYATALTSYFLIIFPQQRKYTTNTIFLAIFFTIPVFGFILEYFKIFYISFKLILLLYILIGGIVLFYNYFTTRSVSDRAAIGWIVIAFLFFLSFTIIFVILLPILTGHEIISHQIGMLTSLIVPVSFAFAITRYRLMDIDSLFDNTLVYVITLALLAFMDFVIISVIVALDILEINSVLTLVLGIWFIIIGYLPIRDMVQRYIKRSLKRNIYDMNEVSLLLSRELISVQDMKEAFSKVAKILHKTLYPIGSSAHLLGEKGSIQIYGDNTDMPPIPVAKMEKTAEPTLLYQMTRPENLSDNYSGGVFVPVMDHEKKQVGYFLLQNKESGRLYDRDDMRFLDLSASQLAMAIEAISAREKAIIEKERLSKEIYDGVGTTLAQALIMTRDSAKYKTADLQKLLSDGLEDMRELLWAVDKRESCVKRTITHILDKLKVMEEYLHIESDIKLLNEEIPLSPGVRINLTRIVQEAVSNVLKHSGTDKAYLSFVQKENILEVTIRDEGTGFDVSQEAVAGHYGLGNIKRRSEEIGAQYSIISEKGKGTTISIKLNLIQ